MVAMDAGAEDAVPDEAEHDYHNDRWPASLAVLACIGLTIVLPAEVTIRPRWLVPVLEFAVLVPLLWGRTRHPSEGRWVRRTTFALIALVTLSNAVSVVLLVHELLKPHQTIAAGRPLVFSAILIWITNVIAFSLWFWEVDRGGPSVRTTKHESLPDFLFPQMALGSKEKKKLIDPHWRPRYLDYLYVSLTNASAFSPTDAMPLTRRVKGLMGVQSLISIVTVVVVAARAVNILA